MESCRFGSGEEALEGGGGARVALHSARSEQRPHVRVVEHSSGHRCGTRSPRRLRRALRHLLRATLDMRPLHSGRVCLIKKTVTNRLSNSRVLNISPFGTHYGGLLTCDLALALAVDVVEVDVVEAEAEAETEVEVEEAFVVDVFGFAASLRASHRCFMSSRSSPSALITTISVSLSGALHCTYEVYVKSK